MGVVIEFGALVLRWGLTVALAALVERHVLTPENGDYFSMEFGKHAAMVAGLLLTLAWGIGSRLWSRLKLRLALEAPAGTTDAENTESAKFTVADKI